MVQSFIVGLAVGTSSDLLNLRLDISVILGVVGFALNFLVLERNARRTLAQAFREAQDDIRFPDNARGTKGAA